METANFEKGNLSCNNEYNLIEEIGYKLSSRDKENIESSLKILSNNPNIFSVDCFFSGEILVLLPNGESFSLDFHKPLLGISRQMVEIEVVEKYSGDIITIHINYDTASSN